MKISNRQFLAILENEHTSWENILARIPQDQIEQPGAIGEWSVKDLIAHITWYEKEMLDLVLTRTLAGSILWKLPPDERNAAIFAHNRARSLEDVLLESRTFYPRLHSELNKLTDDDLNNPAHFTGMPLDWIPWQIIAQNTFEHYHDHTLDLQRLLDKQSSERD